MITVSLGSHRFESGPTFHYNASDVPQLTEIMFSPEQTTEYVNALPGVKATVEEVRQVAAAGIVRLAIDTTGYANTRVASEMLLDVCNGNVDAVARDLFQDHSGWNDRCLVRGALSNAVFDSASILATRKNDASKTAEYIQEELSSDQGILMIGLANGGILSAAHTFLQLPLGDNVLSFIKYSRHKDRDSQPQLTPYPDERKRALLRAAAGRQVVIYDEDYSSKKTLTNAVEFFRDLFAKQVLGIAPVEVERRITYKPFIIVK